MDEKTPKTSDAAPAEAARDLDRWPESFHLEGASDGVAATLDLDAGGVRWKRGEDGVEVPLGALRELRIASSTSRGLASLAGVVGLALGALWLVDSALPRSAALGAIAGGLVVLALARLWPRCAVELSAEGLSARLECAGASARAAKEAAAFARHCAPGLRRRPRSILSFLGGELSALVARGQVLCWEYRALAAEPDPRLEARFVRVRRRIAAWNLLWILVIPGCLALAQHAAFPAASAAWAYARAAIVLVVAGLAGMRLLPRLQPLLARWVR